MTSRGLVGAPGRARDLHPEGVGESVGPIVVVFAVAALAALLHPGRPADRSPLRHRRSAERAARQHPSDPESRGLAIAAAFLGVAVPFVLLNERDALGADAAQHRAGGPGGALRRWLGRGGPGRPRRPVRPARAVAAARPGAAGAGRSRSGSASASSNNPLGPGVIRFTGPFSVGFTIFWIVGMINSINWIDGLDGLSYRRRADRRGDARPDQPHDAGQPAADRGPVFRAGRCSLLGFLRWNFHPAKIFTGTTGVQFVGYTLAVLAVLGTAKVAVALLVLGVPIIDTFWIIVGGCRRVARRSRRPVAHPPSAARPRAVAPRHGPRHLRDLRVLALLALLLSRASPRLYAFISVFILFGLVLFGPTRGASTAR